MLAYNTDATADQGIIAQCKISIWLPRLSTVLTLKTIEMMKRNFILGFPKHLSRRDSNVKYRNSNEIQKHLEVIIFKHNTRGFMRHRSSSQIDCWARIDCCKLFLTEKLYVVSFGNKRVLNKNSEFVNACRHKIKLLLKSLKNNRSRNCTMDWDFFW